MQPSHTTAHFSILLLYSQPDSKAFNNCIVMSLVLMLKNLSEAVILFVLYNLLISTLWFPLRKSCSGFVLEMLSHIHTLSVEQFTITVIAGPSESPDRSLAFFSFSYTDILTKKRRRKKFHIGFELTAYEEPNNRTISFHFCFLLKVSVWKTKGHWADQCSKKFLVLLSIS